MEVFTIGFTRKTAAEFFGALRRARVESLIDVRLNNVSQLAGFTKRDDLAFFIRELCGAAYVHEPRLAPTKEILEQYKKRGGDWHTYEREFLDLMSRRRIEVNVDRQLFEQRPVLLCSEPTPEHCHRRLVVEYLAGHWDNVSAVHL